MATCWSLKGSGASGQSVVGTTPLPNYSFDEQANGRLWVDGRNVYQKTIDLGMLPNAGTNSVLHGIVNIEQMIELQGSAVDPSGPFFIRLPHVDATDPAYSVGFFVDGTNVQITAGIDRSTFHGYCTLIYTCSDR